MLSKAELAGALPSASGSSSLSSSPEVKTLRKLLDDIDTLKAEREAIESEFKNSSDDMGRILVFQSMILRGSLG